MGLFLRMEGKPTEVSLEMGRTFLVNPSQRVTGGQQGGE